MQPIQNTWEPLNRLRAIPACIVQQNDAAITPLLLHAPQNDVRSRLCPVLRVDTLQNDEIIEVFRDLQWSQFAKLRRARVSCVRRTKQRGRATCYCLEQKLCRVQLKPDVLRPAERQVWMIISVVPDLVPFVDNATNQTRITLRVHADEEKRCFYVRGF